jgi:cyclase
MIMLTKRIIPCLDVKDGRVVKGINFKNLLDAGDPVETGKVYAENGADELVFLDISASLDKRKTVVDMVKKVSEHVFIPFTVGGGIKSIEDIREVLRAGADKVSLNTAAIDDPDLIREGALIYGNQCIVVAIDAIKNKNGNGYHITKAGGTIELDIDALEWAKKVESLGAGEILLTSMDRDGTKEGFDIELTRMISDAVSIPVIASGGAGTEKDFFDVLTEGHADAALAASLFHYGILSISDLKKYLQKSGLSVRSE